MCDWKINEEGKEGRNDLCGAINKRKRKRKGGGRRDCNIKEQPTLPFYGHKSIERKSQSFGFVSDTHKLLFLH